jgi:hypothetical protein
MRALVQLAEYLREQSQVLDRALERELRRLQQNRPHKWSSTRRSSAASHEMKSGFRFHVEMVAARQCNVAAIAASLAPWPVLSASGSGTRPAALRTSVCGHAPSHENLFRCAPARPGSSARLI